MNLFPFWSSILFFFIGQQRVVVSGGQFPEPTRNIDLWNPFGTSSTRTPGLDQRPEEVLVPLSIGEIVGHRVIIPNVPWTPWQDPNEQMPSDRARVEPNPLPDMNSVSVFTFLGVPYAEPPVGQRRFKSPQQLNHFPGPAPFAAFTLPHACAQDVEAHPSLFINEPYPYAVSEDCLYLNIFTPAVKSHSSSVSNALPVMVFLHGGNFQTGTANDWPGHVLASRGIVVVAVNYRLGPFGFMSLGDELTGNYGLQDQRVALQWVQQHIASFGGDPQAVTIVGHDAGAVSAGIHMLSPFSKNLFRGVVAMSGAEVSYHSSIGKPALAFNNTMKLGRYLGCVHPVASEVWSCILTRSTDDIVQAVSSTAVPSIPVEFNRYLFLPSAFYMHPSIHSLNFTNNVTFRLSVNGHELTAHPLWLLNNVRNGIANVFSVPFLAGLNAHDGIEAILEDRTLGEFTEFLQITHQYMRSFIIEYAFRHNYTMNREAIVGAIESFYTYWPDPSDVWQPITQSAHLHSETGSRTFLYVNNYNFSKQRENVVTSNGEVPNFPAWSGSCHDCDLYLLFGFAFMPTDLLPKAIRSIDWTDVDRNASQLFSSFVRQFVKYSDPNFHTDGTWLAHEPRAHWYLNFNYTRGQSLSVPGTLSRDFRFEQVAFWQNFIPGLVNYMTTTFPPEEGSVRNELVLFRGMFGVSMLALIALLVLALSFGYNVCTRPLRERCGGGHSEWEQFGSGGGEGRRLGMEMRRQSPSGIERMSSL
uniref:Carboxylesterase type B domain-containing protein n=1 Tax=Globodera rostochiensis TaxID=31243 RepID=A0A914GZ99_GLORO